MKKLLRMKWGWLPFCLAMAGAVVSCSDDKTDEKPQKTEYYVAEFLMTDMPQTVPAGGGTYKMTFEIQKHTRSTAPTAGQVRVRMGEAVGDPQVLTPDTRELPLVIGENRSKDVRPIVVELYTNKTEGGGDPEWTIVAEAEQEAGLKDYLVSQFESTDMPETVSYNGGAFEFRFKTETVTRAPEAEFVPWLYRLTIGDEVGEAVAVNEPIDKIELTVGSNYTELARPVVVETAEAGDAPQWTRIAEAEQAAGLMLVAEFYWAKGNVAYADGKFILAESMSESGCYFRHGSNYAVPSDGPYQGTAYTPEPVQIALADIPENVKGADPCSQIDPGLRMPTYMELYYLIDQEDYKNLHTLDGVNGMGYLESSYFIPYAGSIEIATGNLVGKSSFGGYWGSGANFAGDGVIYTLNEEYSLLDYDLSGTHLAAVRCVKNTKQPRYLSHTSETAEGNASFSMTIQTDPGDFRLYEVALEASDGDYTQTDATPSKTEVNLTVPKNETTSSRTWRLYVNRVYMDVEFVQPGMKDYALYVSHKPAKASYEAFDMEIETESDMQAFDVTVKGSDGLEKTVRSGSAQTTTTVSIPQNDGKQRTLTIWLDGQNTGKTTVQEGKPSADQYAVVWSPGYLTVADGAYTFAEPKERGMYFKWKSRHGISFTGPVSGSTKYADATVYAPEAVTIPDYADVPSGEVDPCTLVAPAGTWRMPTAALLQELVAKGSKEFQAGAYRMCTDEDQQVFLSSAGQLYKDGSKIMLSTIISVWTADESATKPGQYRYLMWSMTSETNKGSVSTGGVVPSTAMMVRCVKDK